jgi:predicted ester cyclase
VEADARCHTRQALSESRSAKTQECIRFSGVENMADNAALIRRWFEEVWNLGREETIDELCAKDAVGYGQTHDGSDIVGLGPFKEFWRNFRTAFSSIHIDLHQTIEQGDMAMARWSISMTHTGAFLGIAPGGKEVRVSGMSVQRFVGGKIVEAWDNWDQLGLMTQLGVFSLEEMNQRRIA